jgi:hypothetical protein
MRKASKSEVGYSRGMRESHCGKASEDDEGYCCHFIPPPSGSAEELGPCELVAGEISRVLWCRLFARALTLRA